MAAAVSAEPYERCDGAVAVVVVTPVLCDDARMALMPNDSVADVVT